MRHLPLHRRTKQVLAELAKAYGTEVPWSDCHAEICELDELVRRTLEPAEIDQLAILDEGVEVGAVEDTGRRWWQFWKPRKRRGTRFYALTLNAEDWFEEWCRSFPDAPEMQLAGWLYASAHSMQPEKLMREWNNKYHLAWHVWLWRCRCGIKRGQIAPLQRMLMPETPWPKLGKPDEDQEGFAGHGWLTAALGTKDGDHEYWKNKVPFVKALQRYRDLSMYGDGDAEIKRERWEQWRTGAEAEVQLCIRRLRKAWEAVQSVGAPDPSTPKPEADKRNTEAPEGVSGAKAEAAQEKPASAPGFAITEESVKEKVMGRLAEMDAGAKV